MTDIVKKSSFLDYAPAPESTSILHLQKSYGLFIDGEFVKGHGKSFQTISPSTEKTIAEIANANAKDVDTAVAAARRAYDRTWSKLSGADRGKYLFRIARLLQERARELAVAESLDNGKPIKESRDVDVPLVAAWFFYYAGWADKLDYAGLGPSPRALGVAAQVIPWNFPLLMLAWKVAPALAAGNTVVIKPAETTPLSALIFAEILQQAELPAGVVNIITGAGDTGEALVNHPDVNKVAFTGSTGVGRAIAKSVAGTGKKLTLELDLGEMPNLLSCDRQRLLQVFGNLIGNAIKFCDQGSRIRVSGHAGTGVLHFVVEDSGPGIEPANIGNVFKPFFSTKSEGMGLGLAICKTIVDAHGGQLTVTPNGVSGTVFKVMLPIDKGERQ